MSLYVPPGYTIRAADPRDLDALYTIAADTFFLESITPEMLAEKLFDDRRHDEFRWVVYVAEHKGRVAGFMQGVSRPAQRKAWMGLFGVAAVDRRRGLARALYAHIANCWPLDTAEVEALAIPCNYLLPGLDPRYTEALCLLESLGFQRFTDCVNMGVELNEPFPVEGPIAELAGKGVQIRRATPADRGLLDAFFEKSFGDSWRYEAELTFRNDPPSLHLAFRDERVIAFSAHSTQNREWGFFGPMGTTPECRGLGVGRVLLWLCLNDLRDAGQPTAVIPWVGPISFYHRWANCRVERVFWRYRRTLTQQVS
ncbi:MAG: GNAT family N-acetyltransferase [Planctomycetes bacterium]|nr:GNAT family N-acetyltransferase [Planctomycetota bacterium]